MNDPRRTPKRKIASTAYSEHVGVYRQDGGNMGEIAHLYARNRPTAAVLGKARIPLTLMLFAFCNRLFDDFKCFGNFVPQIAKLGGQKRSLGVDHNVGSDIALHTI